MNKISININDIYVNLLLIAISRKHDFKKLVEETEEETRSHVNGIEDITIPEGYCGLFFTELLARKMGSTLGEAYSLSKERREEILQSILEQINPICDAYDVYYNNNEDGSIEFQGMFDVLNAFDDEGLRLYIEKPSDVLKEYVFSFYTITFKKIMDGFNHNSHTYSICLSTDNDLESDYIYSDFEVWSGTSGLFADYIEKVIAEYTDTHTDSNKVELDEQENYSEIVLVEKQRSQQDGSDSTKDKPKIIDELVTYVWDDTRTVGLLDKFEGFGSDSTVYQHIVIKNCGFYKRYDIGYVGLNLVIERGRGRKSDYIGNITFTDFKKGYTGDLRKHVENEISEEIVEQYLDKDRFYRFSKPYLLRAQNSSNRTGYGWEWDWSGGIGSYTEGTLYGETTNYLFVGAYITSSVSGYEPAKRKPFLEEKVDILPGNKMTINSDNLNIYYGKLCDATANQTIHKYLKINTTDGVKHIPISYDEKEGIYYIHVTQYNKHRQSIENADYELINTIAD